MPLVGNSTQNENNMEPFTPKKVSKLSVILIVLILISGVYLGYSLYISYNQTELESSDINKTTTNVSKTTNTSNSSISTNETKYTQNQVAEKNSKTSCWTIIEGNVYDITSYIPNHPGGEKEILQICGKDGSQLFAKPMEHKEGGANNVLNALKIGVISQ